MAGLIAYVRQQKLVAGQTVLLAHRRTGRIVRLTPSGNFKIPELTGRDCVRSLASRDVFRSKRNEVSVSSVAQVAMARLLRLSTKLRP